MIKKNINSAIRKKEEDGDVKHIGNIYIGKNIYKQFRVCCRGNSMFKRHS